MLLVPGNIVRKGSIVKLSPRLLTATFPEADTEQPASSVLCGTVRDILKYTRTLPKNPNLTPRIKQMGGSTLTIPDRTDYAISDALADIAVVRSPA